MNREAIEREIGLPPGNLVTLDERTMPLVRQWLTTHGFTEDRALAARPTTLERCYRQPEFLRRLLWRGDYTGGKQCDTETKTGNHRASVPMKKIADAAPSISPITGAGSDGNSYPSTSNGHGNGSQPPENTSSSTPLSPQHQVTDIIAAIVCGELADDDCRAIQRALLAHFAGG